MSSTNSRSGRARAGAALLLALLASLRPGAAAGQFPPEVRGIVVERASGVPVPGAAVAVDGGSARAETGADGTFRLRGLFPGEHLLTVEALGYATARLPVEARNGRAVSLRIALDPAPVSLPGVESGEGAAASPGLRVIGPESLRDAGAEGLADVLEGVPGVDVIRRGPGQPVTLSIRGSSPDQVLVLLDGTRLNSGLTGEADLSTVSPASLERVVVITGAEAARYGPGALAGAVLLEGRGPAGPPFSVRAGAGSFGERAVGASVAGETLVRGAALGGRVVADWRRIRGDFGYAVPAVRGGGRAERRNADAAVLGLTASGELEVGAVAARSSLHWTDLERGMPGSIVQPSLHGRQEQERWTGSVALSGSAGPLRWSFSARGDAQEAAFRDPDPPLGPAYDEGARVRALDLTGSGAAGGTGWSAEAGLDVRRQWVRSTTLAEAAPVRRDGVGLWLQGRLETGDRWRLALTPGLRVDGASDLERAHWSPRVGASMARGAVTVRLSAGHAFSPPTISDQFFQEGVLARPNPDLEPERVRGEVELDLEARLDLPGGARADVRAAAFRADVDGMIVWFPDHRFVWSPTNVDVRRSGWEADATLVLPHGDARLTGLLSHTRVVHTSPGLDGQLPYRPAWTAEATASVGLGPLRPDVAVRRVGERRTVAGSPLNALGPYTVVDLGLRGRHALGGWEGELRLVLENALDARGSLLTDHPVPGRALRAEGRLHLP